MTTLTMKQFFSWWLWRRWHIYCPVGYINHYNKVPGLFDWNEAFVPPCSLNEVYSGRYKGSWTPRVSIVHTMG